MMRYFTLLATMLIASFSFSQVNLPIDFESTTVTYTFSDFGGGSGSVIDNPDMSGINTSAKVGKMIKFAGEVYGGSTLALGAPVVWDGNNAVKMKVWANRVGGSVLFKLEGSVPHEVAMPTTVANQWEELTFNFAGFTAADYTGITLIYDLGTVGDGTDNFTFYFDDIQLTTITGGIQLPIDFESTTLTYTFNDFAGGAGSVIDNPDMSGINTSAKVGKMVKSAGEVYGGTTLPLGGPIVWGDNNAIKMKVWAYRVGAPVLFKLEGPAPTEISVSTTVANQWEELTFNFSAFTANTYTGITLIYDLGVAGDGSDNFTFYFDDIELTNSGAEVVKIPVDFESETLTYSFSDFAGGAATVIDNPDMSGINTSAKVGKMVKSAGEVYGGSTLALGAPVVWDGKSSVKMKVWANRVGASVLFKLEGPAPHEVAVPTTTANQWEDLTFDFTGFTAANYTGITVIYELGTVGDGSDNFTFYFDDIRLADAGGLAQINLPVTFEDAGVNYALTDFGGNASTVEADPTNAANTVAKTIKTTAAELWAGTTIGTAAGFASAIPFAESDTKMTVRVWSPDAGIPIRLKAEDKNDGTHSVETEAMTTVAGDWETLEFDFSMEASGTAAINFAYTYDKLSIFFNFGTTGAMAGEKTYYWDDVKFGGITSVRELRSLNVEAYPNPATDQLWLGAEEEIQQVILYNLAGQPVRNVKPNAQKAELDLADLPPGVFVLSVRINDQIGTMRVVKH